MSSRNYFLMPSQIMITTSGAQITTVLGSCISVCLWDKQKKVGGINHYLLPGCSEDSKDDLSKGYTSIPVLLRSMINRGCDRSVIEAKIFGGCSSALQKDVFEIGKKNALMALEKLSEAGIPIVARSTGGRYGRKIVFDTETGKVKMQLLTKTAHEINEEVSKGFSY